MGSVALAAALVAYNSLANRWKPFHGWAYAPLNIAMLTVVLIAGRAGFGMDAEAMGLRWRSAWIGAAIAAACMAPVYGLLTFERGRALLRDRRLAGVTGSRAAYTMLVRIPVGTALVEEVAFRGVLLGSLLDEGRGWALAGSSVAFGLWHVVPTMILARTNRLATAVVPAGVVFTAAVGVFLGWLRIHTGSVGAPFLLHAMVNSLGAGAAMIALRRAQRQRGPTSDGRSRG